MKNLAPYLLFAGNCREAMEFYKDCLNGEITIMQTCGESEIDFPPEADEMIFNSELKSDGICIMASDNPELTENKFEENNFSLFVSFSDATEFKSVTAKLSKDGKVNMSVSHEDHFVMLSDKFGVSWMLTLKEGK